MVKIVNGQIVPEDGECYKNPLSRSMDFSRVTSNPSSPIIPPLARSSEFSKLRRRRSSIQEMQLQEEALKVQMLEAQKSAEETVVEPQPTWSECFNEKIKVYGIMLAVKHMFLIAFVSIVLYGIQGLLACLLAVYIGTLFKPDQYMMTDKVEKQTELSKSTENAIPSPTLPSSSPSPPRSPPTTYNTTRRRFSTLSDLSVPTSA